MPELPEVETVVRNLKNAGLIGQEVLDVDVSFHKLVEVGDVASLLRAKVTHVWRFGKYIIIDFDMSVHLIVHLRMTGRLFASAEPLVALSHEKGKIRFTSLMLHYADSRTFGRWYVVDNAAMFLSHLGQDPMSKDFDAGDFCKRLERSNKCLKALLLDQSIIAGVGNIYADEVLFQAKIHPLRRGSDLIKKEKEALVSAIIEVLSLAIQNRGSSLGTGKSNFQGAYGSFGAHQDFLKVYKKDGSRCPVCKTLIKKITVSQRSTHFCPKCQPLMNN